MISSFLFFTVVDFKILPLDKRKQLFKHTTLKFKTRQEMGTSLRCCKERNELSSNSPSNSLNEKTIHEFDKLD
jgi:hypothetical protein